MPIPTLRRTSTLALLRQWLYRTSEAPWRPFGDHFTTGTGDRWPFYEDHFSNVMAKDNPEDRQGAVYNYLAKVLECFTHRKLRRHLRCKIDRRKYACLKTPSHTTFPRNITYKLFCFYFFLFLKCLLLPNWRCRTFGLVQWKIRKRIRMTSSTLGKVPFSNTELCYITVCHMRFLDHYATNFLVLHH